MAMEPITIFSRLADPAAVARLLREIAPQVEFDGPDDDWRTADVTFRDRGTVRGLTFHNDPDYHAEPNWSEQMSGMRAYFSRFPDTERKPLVMGLTTTLRFSLGAIFEPDYDPEGDPRLDIVCAVAARLDGVLFSPSALRDRNGQILFSSAGASEEDADAVWPQVVAEVSTDEPYGAALHEMSRPKASAETSDAAETPSAARVARRAVALGIVTMRAILEQEAGEPSAGETHRHLIDWLREVHLEDELEPDESEVVHRRVGRLGSQQQINATWRLEGLVVLAWSLGRFEIPPHDQLVDTNALWESLGIFETDVANALMANPVLRTREEINTLRNRLFAIHWRLRNFGLRPQVMDFSEYARTCSFGPLDLTGLPLVKGDLAINGKRLDRAPKELLGTARSAAQERHQAANWLLEGPERYSDASTAT